MRWAICGRVCSVRASVLLVLLTRWPEQDLVDIHVLGGKNQASPNVLPKCDAPMFDCRPVSHCTTFFVSDPNEITGFCGRGRDTPPRHGGQYNAHVDCYSATRQRRPEPHTSRIRRVGHCPHALG